MPSSTDTDEPADNQQDNLEQTVQAIMHGATLKEIRGVPDHVMEALYAHAYNFYQKGMLDEAQIFFKFLCSYDSYDTRYFLGLGAVHHQKKNYAEAISMYYLAFLIDEHNYPAMFYSGQCYLLLKGKAQAQHCFGIVAHGTGPEQLKKQARAYLAVMQPDHTAGVAHA